MENFGLGVVLSLTDNATGAMNNIMGSLEKLQDEFTKAGSSLGGLAGQLSNLPTLLMGIGGATTAIGASLSAPFIGMAKSSIEAGATLENQMNMLSTLYGSAEKGKEAYLWAQKFAAESPMALADVIGMMQTLKPIGADVAKMYQTANGGSQQLLKFITDFSAARPDVPVFRIQSALRNLAGGNYQSIQQIFDLPNDVIARMKQGKDIGEKIAIAVNGLGVSGFTEKMNGSWQQMMSNLEDSWEAFKTNIANEGVFENAKSILKEFFDVINDLSNEDMKNMAMPIAEGISAVLAPVGLLVKGLTSLVATYRDLSREYPELVGGIMKVVSALGTLLTVVGSATLLYGVFLKLKTAYSAFMMSALGTTKLLTAMRVGFMAVARSALATVASMLPFIAIAGLFYLAWRTNFLGVRDLVTNVITKIVDIFNILVDFLDGKLSKKNFNLAQQYGMLDFLATWAEVSRVVQEFGKGLVDGIKKGLDYFEQLNQKYVNFKEMLGLGSADRKTENADSNQNEQANTHGFGDISNEQAQSWGEMGAIILGVATAFRVLYGVVKFLAPVFRVLFAVIRFLGPVFSFLGSTLAWVARIALVVASAIAAVVGVPVWVVGVVIALIVGLVALIYNYWDEVCVFFEGVWQAILAGFNAFCEWVGAGFNTICALCQSVWDAIVDFISSAIDSAIATFDNLYSSVTSTMSNIYDYVSEVWNNIKETLSHPIDAVVNFIKTGDSSAQEASGWQVPFANGGIVTRPTPALVGEAGYPEVIVPIDNSKNAVGLWQTAGRMLGLIGSETDTKSSINYNKTTASLNSGLTSMAKSFANQNQGADNTNIDSSDNRVIFNEGSIVVYATPNQDPYAIAREVIAQTQRETEIRAMMKR